MAATPGKFFIGGLNPQLTTTDSLRQYFENFGEVIDAIVMIKGGRSRGFGFVTFAVPEILPVDFAEQLHIIDGKQVDVKPAVPEAESSINKLFVGGLAATTTTNELQEYFSQFGDLTDVVAMVAHGQPRGFGFVTFNTPEEAASVLSVPTHVIDGKVVDVKKAEPKGSPFLAPPAGRYAMPVPFGGRFGRRGGAPGPIRGGYASKVPAYGASVPLNTSKIFVGGLTPETTEDSLIMYFSQFGNIAECEIMRREGLSRGFGFVIFSRPSEAQQAIAPHFHVIDGKAVEVKACLPKEIAPPPQRLMGGGGLPAGYGAPRFAPRVAAVRAPGRAYLPRVSAPRYRPY